MRVVVGCSGGAGHSGPVIPVVEALVARGEQVSVIAPAAAAQRFAHLPVDVRVAPSPPAEQIDAIMRRVESATPREASVLVNREIFGQLNTRARAAAVRDAVGALRPDLVLHEAAEFAPALVAAEHGIPHAQIAIGLASIERASLQIAEPALAEVMPGLAQAVATAPYLTHLPSDLDPAAYADTRRFRRVGPTPRRARATYREEALVYVSLGTIVSRTEEGEHVVAAAVAALADLPVRVVVSLGDPAARSAMTAPDNVRVERWVDPAEVIPAASVVICHGGAGTMFEALAAGVPLVVVPFRADQPTNAAAVASAGAGRVVDKDAADLPGAIRTAVSDVLTDAHYRQSAARISDTVASLPPVGEVLDTLTATPER